MQITIEAVQARKDKLLSELAQVQANIHAYNGAIQDCDYWLQQLAIEATDVNKPS